MTTIYFVRHAESDRSVRGGLRPLTEKGWADARKIPDAFTGISLDAILSSPFTRAMDTVSFLARERGMEIRVVEDFRERRGDSVQSMSMGEMIRAQWKDFTFTLSDGETLEQVQRRNIRALEDVLRAYAGKTIAIGTHGVALCTMMQYYRKDLGEQELEYILLKTPYIERTRFTDDGAFVDMQEV